MKLEVINPDVIEMKLSITMRIKEWRLLKEQLSNKWPSYDLSGEISDIIRQAESTFYPKV